MKRLALLVGLVVLVAGCGGGGGSKTVAGGGGGGSSAGKSIQIKEVEYSLAPGKVTIASPGKVTFVAKNAGKMGHALEVEGNGVEEKTSTISPGSSAKLTVSFSKTGTYEMYCPIDGHKQLGMKATVVVGGSSSGGGGSTGTTTNGTTSSGGYGY